MSTDRTVPSYQGTNGNLKRKLDENNSLTVNGTNSVNSSNTNGTTNKRVVQDGFSWWTCLTMGMSLENTRPHSVLKPPQ
ncbi:hypothetical protein ACF0H5_005163 [Mactra antiquata]